MMNPDQLSDAERKAMEAEEIDAKWRDLALTENGDNEPRDSEMVEMPADLVRVLRDPGIIVRQDAAVFDLIAKWQKALSGTESVAENGDNDG